MIHVRLRDIISILPLNFVTNVTKVVLLALLTPRLAVLPVMLAISGP